MGSYYQVPIKVTKQEDGLWRVEVPVLQGCWVDAETLEQGIHEIQEVIAMTIDFYLQQNWPLPKEMGLVTNAPLSGSVPIAVDEYTFKRLPAHSKAEKPVRIDVFGASAEVESVRRHAYGQG